MKQIDPNKGLRLQRPESIVFVLSIDKNNKPSGMIAGWNMRASSNPPIISVALSEKGYTHKLIRESKEFVVAVPDKDLEEAVNFFGSTHGDKVDKFAKTKVKTTNSTSIKTPLLTDATLNYECKLINEIKIGDHFVFFGEVIAAHHNPNKKILMNLGESNFTQF